MKVGELVPRGRRNAARDSRGQWATILSMCAACAIAAAAGASGVKAWLQAHHLTWLTEAGMRVVTIALVVAMLAVSTIGFNGSSKPDPGHAKTSHESAQTR